MTGLRDQAQFRTVLGFSVDSYHYSSFVRMATVMPAPADIPTFGSAVITPQKKKLSKAEMEEIKDVGIPNFKYPEPITCSKHKQIAAEESNDWVRKSHLEDMYKSPKVMQKHLANNVSDLIMIVMKDSGEREAVLMGKYTVWGFALDDFFDPDDFEYDEDVGLRVLIELNMVFMWSFPDDPHFRANLVMNLEGEDAEKRNELLKYVDAKIAVARKFPDTVYETNTEQTHPLVRGFGELWKELAESAPRQYLQRWGRETLRYINAFLPELRVRKTQDGVPSLEEFILLRREVVGVSSYSMLCEYGERQYLPYELFFTPEWKRLIATAADLGAWTNDFCSLQKEAAIGDVYNIVIIIQRQQNCSFQEASDQAWQMLTNRIEDFESDFEALKQVTPAEYKDWVDIYWKTLIRWVWGAHHWYTTNGRYKV
nr:terpene synthase [Radula lindenbergiana]